MSLQPSRKPLLRMKTTLRAPLSRARGRSFVTLARELCWRARRDWNRTRILRRMHERACPVVFNCVSYYVSSAIELSDEGRDCIIRAADAVCRGVYPFFGFGMVDLGLTPRWNFDFVSGLDWPQVPTDNPSSIRHDGSDVKVPYELSRLQFLPVLGKAYVLTRNEVYRTTAKDLLSNWIEQNPFGVGINWTVSMEAALRAMSICFLLNLMFPFRKDEQQWLDAVTRSLWEHAAYIEAHNEFSHLVRSNHYLSNILGLYCLSLFLKGEGTTARSRKYRRLLEKEILHQVHSDGVDYEASTGYHVLVTQMFTCAALLMRAAKTECEPIFVERLRSMLEFVTEMQNGEGELLQVGDCDDGRVELLIDDLKQMISLSSEQRDSLRVPSLPAIGAALFGRGDGTCDDVRWYFKECEKLSSVVVSPLRRSKHETSVFSRGGVAIARRAESEVFFFAMPNGIRGNGSHTHNDKLSVAVRIEGEDLLTDRGTYCYTRNADMRNLFRRTASHNTVAIDGKEQNRISTSTSSLFVLSDDAKVDPIEVKELAGMTSFRSAHSGYRNQGVVHMREARLRQDGHIFIEDNLQGTGQHLVEINFHLAPAWRVAELKKKGQTAIFRVEGRRSVEIAVQAPEFFSAESEESFVCRTYGGALIPSQKIIIKGYAPCPVAIKTSIAYKQ